MNLPRLLVVLFLFFLGACFATHAAERPPQVPRPPQAPEAKSTPKGTPVKTCTCLVDGECTCGDACNCGAVASTLAETKAYARAYEQATETGKPLVVWVGIDDRSEQQRLPQYVHCRVSRFEDAEPGTAVIAKVEDGRLIRVDDLPNPTAGAIENAMACHRARRENRGRLFGGFLRGGCSGGSCR
jgi:hypothetical protein